MHVCCCYSINCIVLYCSIQLPEQFCLGLLHVFFLRQEIGDVSYEPPGIHVVYRLRASRSVRRRKCGMGGRRSMQHIVYLEKLMPKLVDAYKRLLYRMVSSSSKTALRLTWTRHRGCDFTTFSANFKGFQNFPLDRCPSHYCTGFEQCSFRLLLT